MRRRTPNILRTPGPENNLPRSTPLRPLMCFPPCFPRFPQFRSEGQKAGSPPSCMKCGRIVQRCIKCTGCSRLASRCKADANRYSLRKFVRFSPHALLALKQQAEPHVLVTKILAKKSRLEFLVKLIQLGMMHHRLPGQDFVHMHIRI